MSMEPIFSKMFATRSLRPNSTLLLRTLGMRSPMINTFHSPQTRQNPSSLVAKLLRLPSSRPLLQSQLTALWERLCVILSVAKLWLRVHKFQFSSLPLVTIETAICITWRVCVFSNGFIARLQVIMGRSTSPPPSPTFPAHVLTVRSYFWGRDRKRCHEKML